MLSTGAAPQQELPHCHAIGPFVLFFERGSAALDARSVEVLDDTTKIVTTDICLGGSKIELYGHIDKGERKSLALTRAKVARDYLVGKGVEPTRIKVLSYGSREPRMYSNIRSQNQRVEIMFDFR